MIVQLVPQIEDHDPDWWEPCCERAEHVCAGCGKARPAVALGWISAGDEHLYVIHESKVRYYADHGHELGHSFCSVACLAANALACGANP